MDIVEPIWKGVITGILFTLTFGVVFFSLIQTSIKRGLKKALFIATGVIISDAFFISLAVWGSSLIADEMQRYDLEIRCVGFIFLLILGIRSIVKKETVNTDAESALTEKRGIIYLAKGVIINSINPMVLLSWIAVTTYVQTVNNFKINQIVFYYLIVLTTMFFTMFGIVYFAGKLRNILSPENMHRLNIVSGIIFMIFASVIIWPVFGLGTF